MRSFLARVSTLLALAAISWACRSERPIASPLRVGYASGITTSSMWVAERAGYFAEQGVEIAWHRMDRPSTALPQLVADHFDVMALHLTAPLFQLVGRGERIRIVADRGHHAPGGCGYGAVVIRRDLDLGNLPRRMRAGISPTRWAEYLFDRFRAVPEMAGVEWELVDLPAESEAQALAGGSLDLASMSEPLLTRSVDAGLVRVWRTAAEIAPYAQQIVLVFGPRLLDRERELGERFLTAYLRAERELAQGKTEENVARLAEALDFDREITRRMCWISVRDDLTVSHDSLADYQRWARDEGLLDRVVSAAEYWDGSFAAAAVRRLDSVAKPGGSR